MSEYDNNIKVDSLDSTLVTEGYKPNRDSALRLNRSLQSLSSPYSEPVRLKFPKKLCRKQTSMTMLIETGEEQPRPSLRVFNEFKQSTVFEGNPENNSYKRMRSPGVFHSLSLESKTPPPQSRSIEDIGVGKNRRRTGVFRQIRNDPILIGESTTVKSKLKPIQQYPKSYRDKGDRIKDCFIWQKPKPKSYLERFRATCLIKKKQ